MEHHGIARAQADADQIVTKRCAGVEGWESLSIEASMLHVMRECTGLPATGHPLKTDGMLIGAHIWKARFTRVAALWKHEEYVVKRFNFLLQCAHHSIQSRHVFISHSG
jgi:hypothetical protein